MGFGNSWDGGVEVDGFVVGSVICRDVHSELYSVRSKRVDDSGWYLLKVVDSGWEVDAGDRVVERVDVGGGRVGLVLRLDRRTDDYFMRQGSVVFEGEAGRAGGSGCGCGKKILPRTPLPVSRTVSASATSASSSSSDEDENDDDDDDDDGEDEDEDDDEDDEQDSDEESESCSFGKITATPPCVTPILLGATPQDVHVSIVTPQMPVRRSHKDRVLPRTPMPHCKITPTDSTMDSMTSEQFDNPNPTCFELKMRRSSIVKRRKANLQTMP